jgi:serine/threonine protein kinase
VDNLTERVGSELVSGISLRAVLDENLLGASFAAETSAHGSVVVELLDGDASAELGADFIEGARRAAAIDHPSAVPVLGHGVTRHSEAYVIRPSFVGERGRDLVQRRPARIPPVEALRLVGDLLDVLATAHAAGLVHGGLTTSELFITDEGSIRLLGLGWSEVQDRRAAPGPAAGSGLRSA